MPLKIYNTLTKEKSEFKPLHAGFVGMYVCGPTVYSHSHIGHGKSYVSFDVIVRYLRYLGNKVLYVQNITDVGHLLGDTNEGEDRLIKQSRIEQKHPMELAEEYTRSYFEDMDALGVLRPDISPRATGHIIEQIELTKQLVEKGYAYEANGSVYFDVRKFADYGKLSRRPLDEMVQGIRVGVRPEKRNPQDFALWKKAEPEHIMRWPSPWGEGFPGWHIECSAMSMKYLGETFDIHGGGLDNQFPHHECEIAQSVCATGKPFVNYWMHNNLVTVGGQKMSKSLENFTTLKDTFQKYDPLVVRFFILQSHYRSTLDFSDEALLGAKRGYERLVNSIQNIDAEMQKPTYTSNTKINLPDIESYKTTFLETMDDDFNTPKAIATLFDLTSDINGWLSSGNRPTPELLTTTSKILHELAGGILGLLPEREVATNTLDGSTINDVMRVLIDVRNEARKQKLFSLSDMIRDGLKKIGVVLEDKKDETVWKKSS